MLSVLNRLVVSSNLLPYDDTPWIPSSQPCMQPSSQVCCLIPPWFAALASIFTGLVTYEVSRSEINDPYNDNVLHYTVYSVQLKRRPLKKGERTQKPACN